MPIVANNPFLLVMASGQSRIASNNMFLWKEAQGKTSVAFFFAL
jgi:hypothetical protein